MAAETYDALAKVLRELPDRFGPAVFSDRRRVVSVLSDRVPEARREIKVLGSAIDDGVFDALSGARPEQIALEIDRLAARIETNLGIRSDIALPVVRACAHGLGRGPLPSEYGSGASHHAPSAVPQSGPEGTWIGSGPMAGGPVSGPHSAPIPRHQPDGSWVGVSAPAGAPAGAQYGAPPPHYGAHASQYPPQPAGWPSSGPDMAPAGPYPYPGAPPAQAAGKGGWVKWLLIGIGAIVAVLVVLYIIGSVSPPPEPAPTPTPTPTPKPSPQPPGPTPSPRVEGQDGPVTKPEREAGTPTPTPTPAPTPPGPTSTTAWAEENANFGVSPQRTLQSNVGSPTPTTIPVGRVLSTQALYNEIQKGTDFLLVDVLEGAHPQTIIKARYIPYGGRAGNFNDLVQQQLVSDLAGLVGGKGMNYPIVFFCQGVRCWESYNAVLRAYEAGYRNLYWYRGGLASWRAAGYPMQPLR